MKSMLNQKIVWKKKTGTDRHNNLSHEAEGTLIKARFSSGLTKVFKSNGNIEVFDGQIWTKEAMLVDDLVVGDDGRTYIIKNTDPWRGRVAYFGTHAFLMHYV